MTSVETQLTLQADEEEVVEFLDEHGGLLLCEVDDPATYWAVLHPRSAPAETFYVRLGWTSYTAAPPSVRFHDGIGGPFASPRAWPTIAGYRPGSWDICKPFTAEGYAVHPEWVGGPQGWHSTGNPFLYVVQTLQFDLNNGYQGRAG
jgi:hypothetical protein